MDIWQWIYHYGHLKHRFGPQAQLSRAPVCVLPSFAFTFALTILRALSLGITDWRFTIETLGEVAETAGTSDHDSRCDMHIYLSLSLSIYIHTYIYICIYVYMYTHAYAYVYIIYKYILFRYMYIVYILRVLSSDDLGVRTATFLMHFLQLITYAKSWLEPFSRKCVKPLVNDLGLLVSYVCMYHMITYHMITYHIISYDNISYHIISYHIISYHMIT